MKHSFVTVIPLLILPSLVEAQVTNPCKADTTPAIDPKFLYFESVPADYNKAAGLNIRVTPIDSDIPIQTTALQKFKSDKIVGIADCYQIPVSSNGLVFNSNILRDGQTPYRVYIQLDGTTDALDSEWSLTSNPFILPAPMIPRLSAPSAVRLK